MFTWGKWRDGLVEVRVETVEEITAFLNMIEEHGYRVHVPHSAYKDWVKNKGAQYVHSVNGMYTYINSNRFDARDVVDFKCLLPGYSFPSKSTLMEFLCEG